MGVALSGGVRRPYQRNGMKGPYQRNGMKEPYQRNRMKEPYQRNRMKEPYQGGWREAYHGRMGWKLIRGNGRGTYQGD